MRTFTHPQKVWYPYLDQCLTNKRTKDKIIVNNIKVTIREVIINYDWIVWRSDGKSYWEEIEDKS